ncbi:MSCRAMM family protein [Amycolatopsis cihanbeyliensis]|uniref:Prealbumin-like fold domain-containing protein n=1 Tax=Amycolatopsis cihanbeyliensis TaxID=1128664 RepID=A0A542DHY5_AMYCI|nr:hypothetical protein [Amycolatopsis cihanbeyliensis]TQJ02656.1 hypothetical protein FB471_2391 [Amycolatopsis cihanbeyliensis]
MGETRRTTGRYRRALGLCAATLLGALSVVTLAQPAAAQVDEGIGHRLEPGQPYGGQDRPYDWAGSYLVGGEQVFCVSFALKAPDTDEQYEPGDELLTKWGEKLPADHAANISYLLLRYGDTKDPDEAAALAHLLHSWTAAPRPGHDDLNRNKSFREVGYAVEDRFGELPESARRAVERLEADAEANRGPWSASVTPAEGEQTIGTAAEWTIAVRNARGTGIADVPVTVRLTDATAGEDTEPRAEQVGSAETETETTTTTAAEPGAEADPGTTRTVTTNEEGEAVLQVTPTGPRPKLVAALSAPADRPYVRKPVEADTQRVVSTGGERELTAEGVTSARTQPGVVRIAKRDADSGAGLAGAQLRLTGGDRTAPAVGQDDRPLTGPDGKPLVLTTEGEDGTATVQNLRTPQEVCVVEVGPPSGYDHAFDPAEPPAACGKLEPDRTLTLELANAPNEVPRTIPAGTEATTVASSATTSGLPAAAFAGLGALAALGSLLVGRVARRRFGNRN